MILSKNIVIFLLSLLLCLCYPTASEGLLEGAVRRLFTPSLSSVETAGGAREKSGALGLGRKRQGMVEESTDDAPTGKPTGEPTGKPTGKPTGEPTGEPTSEPTAYACHMCGAGEYWDGTDNDCVDCTPGNYCPGNCGGQVSCDPGTYQPGTSQPTCDVCPSGYYQPLSGQITCLPCPEGSVCSDASAAPVQCNEGTYAPAMQTACIACPSGYFAATQGSSNCTYIPAGYAASSPAVAPTACDPGEYATGGQSTCTVCPEGYRCADATVSPLACPAGTYALAGASTCTPCSPGKECPVTHLAIENDCADGYYSTGALANCTACPAGYTCTDKSGGMEACAPGQYSSSGDASCHACPAGSYCALTTIDVPVPCKSGQYSLGGASACTECAAGYYCPSLTDNQEIACSSGTFSTGGQAACTVCPAGFKCTSTSSGLIEPCAAGYYSLSGHAKCEACPAGSHCPNPASSPQECPAGFYSGATSTSCSPCPAGSECPSGGMETPTECGVGYYSEGGATECTLCTPGYMCPAGSTNPTPAGSECPLGGFCAVSTTFENCPAGSYGVLAAGRSEAHACASCEEGYYCPTPGGTQRDRRICPVGYYCPAGASSVQACPSGYYNDIPGQISEAACRPCPAGKYCYSGSSYGWTCSAGYYCPEGSSTRLACPAGSYSYSSGLYSATQCNNCTAGHYCSGAGYYSRISCPVGTYNPRSGSYSNAACKPCEPGYSCPTTGMSSMLYGCPTGHYCPAGTIDDEYPCPKGTFSDRTDLTAESDCQDCPAGYSCPLAARTGNWTVCPQGHYCPAGTAEGSEYPCPAGTFSDLTMLTAASDCYSCTAGSYCLGGDTAVSGDCPAGYYCPLGTPAATQYPCAAGSYSSATSLASQSECSTCEKGHYCPTATTSMIPCANGTYNPTEGEAFSQFHCLSCEAGYYCLSPATEMVACGKGYYSAASSKECTVCPAGYYCGSEITSQSDMLSNGGAWENSGDTAGKCFPGVFCPEGMDRAPTLLQDACPAGYYCPAGTNTTIACPAGTYGPTTGLESVADCTESPVGYYSTLASTEVTGQCSPGYYCPLNSTSDKEVPCPPRYYRQDYGAGAASDCALCVAGGYCTGANEVPAVCPRGYYCPTGVDSPTSCPLGTYGNSTGLSAVTGCTPCPGGHYCDQPAKTAPSGHCEAGFYCVSGANSSRPAYTVDQNTSDTTVYPTGGLCPPGHYCPEGTTSPVPCDQGTFGANWGATSDAACVQCTAGYYCAGEGNTEPSGVCPAGYYCPLGSTSGMSFAAQRGYIASEGSSIQEPCPSGSFQPNTKQSVCVTCPVGYYCNSTAMVSYAEFVCPMGHYCPAGTAEPFDCPARFFSEVQGTQSEADCQPCTPGSYCATPGLSEPTGKCTAGHFCNGEPVGTSDGGSFLAAPVGQDFGDVCPVGHYCPQGSPAAVQCPRGTYMNATMNDGEIYYDSMRYFCNLCPPGVGCDHVGLTSSDGTGRCNAGHFCAIGAPSRSPVCEEDWCKNMFGICPRGSMCPIGTAWPLNCSEGTYADVTGLSTCTTCPARKYCAGEATETYTSCPQGYYCPQGTGADWEACPRGKFGGSIELATVDECTACTAGMYCDNEALLEPSGFCDDGYMCPSGSKSAQGETDAVPLTLCPAGYWCAMGNVTVCDKGTYCPEGSSYPLSCPLGMYQNNAAQGGCKPCPGGHFCDSHTGLTGTITPQPCPLGHYCPVNSTSATEFPCPLGTFGNFTEYDAVTDCHYCTPGMFCDTVAMTAPKGLCSAGFFCGGNATSAEPSSVIPDRYYLSYVGDTCVALEQGNLTVAVNDICPQGHYCPEGSASPTACPPGTNSSATQKHNVTDCGDCLKGYYCPHAGTVTAERLCPAGYFCPSGTSNPANDDSLLCPKGSYCPTGASEPIPCLPGSFATNNGSDECSPCTEGYFCTGYGLTGPTGACVAGQYCPEGATEALTCALGFYQDTDKSGDCINCPAGFYCPTVNGTTTPVECPRGHFCPQNSYIGTQHQCPVGYYSNNTGLTGLDDCNVCLPGHYCDAEGLPEPKGLCSAGFFCGGNATSAEPSSVIPDRYYLSYVGDTCVALEQGNLTVAVNDICPQGHYCPEGSASPTACPPGTNSSATQKHNVTDCGDCLKGYYCPHAGTVTAERLCPAGYFCPSGTSNPANDDSLLCPKGSYCPTGASEPIPCEVGTYTISNGSTICLECASGYYCDDVLGTAALRICPTGHFCTNGTVTPRQCEPGYFQALEGQSSCDVCTGGYYCQDYGMSDPTECGAGKKCPPGSTEPTTCSTGEFQPSATASQCQLCAAGYYCENVDNFGNGNSTICPIGHYCEAGVASPVQCPPGYYSESEGASYCDPCAPGYYCNAVNGTINPVPCPAGRECALGAIVPVTCDPGFYAPNAATPACELCPQGYLCNHVNGTIHPDNCPKGNYCPEGSYTHTPCPRGYYNDELNRGNCSICPDGFYCNEVNGTVNPVPCPAGHFCPAGTDEINPCALGTYQPQVGQQACDPCPAGWRCDDIEGTINPSRCPERAYCPLGSSNGTFCPDGSFGEGFGKTHGANCTVCPAGVYCQKGLVVDDCAAGYFCRNGAGVATPLVDLSIYSFGHRDTIEFLLSQAHGQCPPDYFCPRGSVDPTHCGNYTIREDTGGQNQTECSLCPSGVLCLPRNHTRFPCPAGRYCPLGTADDAPRCPVGTYYPFRGAESIDDCLPCPAGKFCKDMGIVHYEDGNYECPSGHFCPQGTSNPPGCPGGTYRDEVGAKTSDDCIDCVTPQYCPYTASNNTYNCPPGYFCPTNNTMNATICDPGYYCPELTITPIICPVGHYCPQGSHQPTICYPGTYCPLGTGAALLCPLGFRATEETNFTADVFSTLNTACEMCPPGTHGADPQRLECPTCPAGYVCTGGTRSATPTNLTADNGYICPTGSYCPAGSYVETNCDAGLYQPQVGMSNSSDCLNCAPSTYQNTPGSDFCLPCSSSSASLAGAEACTCVGKNRVFQAGNGWCICKPGYEFVDMNLNLLSEDDGYQDCQPAVYERCDDGMYRTPTSGECVTEDGYCTTVCGPQSGVMSPTLGTCSCNNITTLAEACDATCQAGHATLACNEVGDIVLKDSDGDELPLDFADMSSEGSIDCTVPGAVVLSMSTTNGEFDAVFGTNSAVSTAAVASRRRLLEYTTDWMEEEDEGDEEEEQSIAASVGSVKPTLTHADEAESTGALHFDFASPAKAQGPWSLGYMAASLLGRRQSPSEAVAAPPLNTAAVQAPSRKPHTSRRRLSDYTPSSSKLASPIVCMNRGSSIVWDVTNDEYPTYIKDSLLNTNTDFDYTSFRKLADTASTSLVVTSFAFTFDTAGTYVFGMSSNTEKITVIKVMLEDVQCPTSLFGTGQFVEFQNSHLSEIGVKANDELVLQPDWTLVVALLIAMFTMVVVVVGFLYYFRKQAWTSHTAIAETYRQEQATMGTKIQATKGGYYSKLKAHRITNSNEVHPDELVCSCGGFGLVGLLSCAPCRAAKIGTEAGDTPPSIGIRSAEHEDIEAAAAVARTATDPAEKGDDPLAASIQKQMQGVDDKLESRMLQTNDLLTDLRNNLKKEVDDLKTLLQSTVIDMGLTPENMKRKLNAIYDRIRADCNQRDGFEGEFALSEGRTIEMMEQMERLFSHGAARIAAEVVDELASRIQRAIDKEEADYAVSASDSVGLRAILKQLSLLSDHILNKIEIANEDEIRRSHNTIEAVDRSIEASHIDVPLPIQTALKEARASNADADTVHSTTQNTVNQFRERVPRFVQEMNDGVTALGRKLFDIMETGNDAMVLKEKNHSAQIMGTDFEDLKLAIDLELKALKESTAESKMARELAAQARAELLTLIDEVYGLDGSSVDQRQLAEMMRLLKSGGLSLGPDDDGGGDDDDDEEAPPRSARAVAAAAAAEPEADNTGNIDYDRERINTDLVAQEAEKNMNNASLDSALELEKKRQADMIDAMKKRENVEAAPSADDDDEARRTEEAQALEARLELERGRKLEAMMRADDDVDSLPVGEQRVIGLSNASYAVAMYLRSIAARSAYAHCELKLLSDLVNIDAKFEKSCVDRGSEEVHQSSILERVAMHEDVIAALDKKLEGERTKVQGAESRRRQDWLSAPDNVDIAAETIRLEQMVAEALSKEEDQLEQYGALMTKAAETASQLTLRQTELKIKHFNTPSLDQTIRQSGKNQARSHGERSKMAVMQQRLFLASERSYLDTILSFADTWGINMRDSERQQGLFQRVSVGLEASFQMDLGLSMLEHELEAEAEEALLVADLTLKGASATEMERKIHNHIEASREKAALRQSVLKGIQEKARSALQASHESAVVDHEREYVLAVETVARRNALQAGKTAHSRTATLGKVFKSLRHKHDTVIAMLEAQDMPDHTKTYAKEQVEAERFREESELKAAFEAYSSSLELFSTHTAGMVAGHAVDTEDTCSVVKHYYERESALLKEAYAMDIRRLRCKHYVIEFALREADAMRLADSNRPQAQIEKAMADLYGQPLTDKVEMILGDVLSKASADHQEAQLMLQESASSRAELERVYNTDVLLLRKRFDKALEDIKAEYGQRGHTADDEGLALLLRRKQGIDEVTALATYQNELVDPYRHVMGKHFTASKVMDELRALQQRKQQETEALESALAAERQRSINDLMAVQREKRIEASKKRLENEAALDGLNEVLARKRAVTAKMLEKRKLLRRVARRKELVREGMNEAEAQRNVEEELTAFERAEEKKCVAGIEKDAKRLSEEPLTDALADLKKQHATTSEILQIGLLASEKKSRSALEARLKNRLKIQAQELKMASGGKLSDAEATEEAVAALEVLDKGDRAALEGRLEANRANMEELVGGEIKSEKERIEKAFKSGALSETDYQSEMERINANERLSHALLQQGLETTRTKLRHNLKKRREKLKNKYKQTVQEADPDLSASEVEQKAVQMADDEIERQGNMLERDLHHANNRLAELAAANLDEKVASVKSEHELRLNGLEAGKVAAVQSRKNILMRRLQRRKEIVANSLRAKGKDQATADAIVAKTYQEEEENLHAQAEADAEKHISDLLAEKRAEREGAEKIWLDEATRAAQKEDEEVRQLEEVMNRHREELYSSEGSTTARAMSAARLAATDTINATDTRLAQIREAHLSNVDKLKVSMQERKKQEADSLRARLAEKRRKRQAELESQGTSTEEATAIAEKEEIMHYEMAVDSVNEALRLELQSEMVKLRSEAEEAERRALMELTDSAAAKKESAQASKDMATDELEKIRRDNERSAQKLKDEIAAKRASKESKLKERLAAKRDRERKKLEDESASEDARQAALAKLAAEEEEALAELRRQANEEEANLKQTQLEEQQRAVAMALEKVQQEDVKAAAAAAAAAAVKAVQDQEAQVKQDAHDKELERLRRLHEEETAKATEAMDRDRAKTKGKLGDRLAAKRAKKEKELAEQEAKERAALEERQRKEDEDRAAAKDAYKIWMDALREAMSQADDAHLIGAAKEDFILKATLGKKIVPDAQLTDCVEAIMLDRHTDNTAAMLDRHYQERLVKIKPALESLLEDKADARARLVEELSVAGADEGQMKERLLAFDEEYTQRQREAEAAATAELEPVHVKEQMELKQLQLQDVSRAIMMYTKGDAASEAASASQEKIMEEMAAYRANLEREKVEREERMAQERTEAEARLKEQHAQAMAEMERALAAEQERQEKELAKQKLAVAAKADDAKKEIEEQDKQRILDSFTKEAEAASNALEEEKKKKKDKLAARLKKKRETRLDAAAAAAASAKAKMASTSEGIAEGDEDEQGMAKSDSQQALMKAARHSKLKEAQAAATMDAASLEKITNLSATLETVASRLAAIESHFGGGGEVSSRTAFATAPPAGAVSVSGYMDTAAPPTGETLDAMADSDVALQEKSRLDFGHLLAGMVGLSRVRVVCARSLPAVPANMAGNAFASSYRYDPDSQTLYVHEKKLTSSGDFGLIVIHALSHIKTNPDDMGNDADTTFMGEFYRNMKILSQDLYRRSVAKSNLSASSAPSPKLTSEGSNRRLMRRQSSAGQAQLEKATGQQQHTSDAATDTKQSRRYLRTNSGLSDVGGAVSGAMAMDGFDTASIQNRMKQYAVFGGLPVEFFDRYKSDTAQPEPSSPDSTPAQTPSQSMERLPNVVQADRSGRTTSDDGEE